MPPPRNESSFVVSTFRAASSSRWRTSSGSESAGSSRRAPSKRTPAGMSRKSSSTDSTPIAASIASRSASVSESWLKLEILEVLLVRLDVEERLDLRGVRQADAHEPAGAVRILVHRLRCVHDLLIDLEDHAGERRDHVGDGLHRLDLAIGGLLRGGRAVGGRLEMDELAERVLREPRDAEDGLVAFDSGPVVLG